MTTVARRLRIQYASDLHLEFSDNFVGPALLRPAAPVLALAGDIGNPDRREYRDFLQYCSNHWDKVFVIAGNHEFYSMSAHTTNTVACRLAQMQSIASAFPNVHFMHRDRVDYRGIAFLGCTLWTNTTETPYATTVAHATMNDYKYITVNGVSPVTPEDTTAWHHEDRRWLAGVLASCAETETPAVVITHHLPSYEFIGYRHLRSPLNFCFASRLDGLIRPPVRAWIAGHTHAAKHLHWDIERTEHIQGCVNPRGYPGEMETGYCRDIFVDISTEPVNCSAFDGCDPLLVAASDEGEMR